MTPPPSNACATNLQGAGDLEAHDTQRRVFGPVVCTAIVVGNVVGIGVFLTPGEVARASSTNMQFLGFWVLGALVALAGALVTAELGTLFPRAGGDYVFLRKAYGQAIAGAWGTLSWFATFSGSAAALAVGAMEVIAETGVVSPLREVIFDAGLFQVTFASLGAMALIAIATLANILSVSFAGRAQLLLTWLPISFLFGLSIYSLAAPELVAGVGGPQAAPAVGLTIEEATFSSAFASVFFTYTGWNVLTYMGGDIRNPRHSLPRGILWGLGITLLLYMLLNLSFLQALTLEGLHGERSPGTFIARAMLGDTGATVFAMLMLLLIIGGLNVTIMAGSRVGLAMGRQGLISNRFGRESEHRGTPVFVLVVQAIWCSVLVLTNSFSFLVMSTGSVMLLLSMFTVGSIFIFRRRGLTAPYRTPGYPWVPLFYVVVGGTILLLGIVDGSTSLISGVIVFGVIALRLHFKRQPDARVAVAE